MAVRKCSLGLDSMAGVVESFDASTGYFKIFYDNGASEEMGVDKVVSILLDMGQDLPAAVLPRRRGRGRLPKKRPQLDPAERLGFYGVLDEATENDSGTGSGGLGGNSQTDEGMDMSLSDNSMEGVSLRGSDVVDSCLEDFVPEYLCSEEKHDEYLGSEGVSNDLEIGDDVSLIKRRKLCEQQTPTRNVPLRRSARRTSVTLLGPPDVLVCENIPIIQHSERDEQKLEFGTDDPVPPLPSSSSDLDMDGLPVIDVFSVYSFLMSFSRSLFLSPFRLEALVAALRCEYANPLIDSIHFSLLHALKPHLKVLMEEGFQPAVNCLRNLNWDLLDLQTWPYFLVEYMLFCGSSLRPDLKLAHLKLLDTEYYEQPAKVKLEILRCLCDDVVEVDSLRSELNRRVTDSEPIVDPNNSSRRRNYSVVHDGESSMPQQKVDDIADRNSDECCLCRMDGNLICCDGCPAAFHSRCVGVIKDHLPEGEWLCPACRMDKDGVVSSLVPFKGADFLGRDSHGRLFYGCCGYLLVSHSFDSNDLCHYYNKNDLVSVVNILKSEPSPFDEIRNVISAYWGVHINGTCSNSLYASDIHCLKEALDEKVQVNPPFFLKDNHCCDNFVSVGARCTAPVIAASKFSDFTDSIQPCSESSIQHEEMASQPAVTDPAGNKLNTVSFGYTSPINGFGFCEDSTRHPSGIASIEPTDRTTGRDECSELPGWSCTSEKIVVTCRLQSDPFSYVNYYGFGLVAAAMAEELLPKPSEINTLNSLKPDEVMKSDQLNAICKRFTQWYWYSYYSVTLGIQKEDCGWCFSCRRLNDGECLFRYVEDKHLDGIKSSVEAFTIRSGMDLEKNKESQIVLAMHHILSVEERVRSLLSGPWEKLYYSEQWRRAVLKAYDVASLKLLLLSLESNLRRVALLTEWLKPVDIDQNGGFAASILTGFHWWRGGKLLRQLFCWRTLPRSLASKCSRQAGRKKIPNLFYHEGSDFSKRSKGISWRAAVETSGNVAQLIYQVKDLDSNIKWAEISSAHLFPQCTKESEKIKKLFKQVLVRKRCIEGSEVKYLLDFGKRQAIPAVVSKNGVLLEESSDKRKRFWLNETYVPLNLVKAFEEKKLSRLSKKKDSGQACENGSIVAMKKSKKLNGFTYLFSKVRNSEKHCCGHCNKDVLVREAVNCQHCDGFFHRKHFKVPKGAFATTYTCFKCKEKETAKSKNHKIVGQKRKASMVRKGNPVSMAKKSKENPVILGEKVKKITFLLSNKLNENQPSSVKKLNENQLSSAKKSSNKLVSLVRKSKENLVEVQCRKNPFRMARKLQQNSISFGKKPKLIQRKRKHGLMKRKRKVIQWMGHDGQFEKAKFSRSDNFICWYKKKRSVLQHSYWLNGLLWLNNPSNERGKLFRDTNVFPPMQQAEDVFAKPMCCLCREGYNSGQIFICCEGCRDWFHGDAFDLELESVKNLAGFKCPKCRMRNVPVCPFSKDPAHCIIKIKVSSAYVEHVDVQHKKCNGEPQSAACKECPVFGPSENHSMVK